MKKTWKKTLLWILTSALTAVLALACVACNNNEEESSSAPTQPTALAFVEKKVELLLGETHQLSLNDLQDGETVSYNTTDEDIATVSASGLVEGKGVGQAVIKAMTSQSRSALMQVIVYDPNFYPVPYISLSQTNVCLSVGDAFALTYSYTYLGEALDGGVTFISQDDSIVGVNGELLVAKAAGSTTVTVKGVSAYGETVKTVQVTVVDGQAEFYPSYYAKEFYVGQELPLIIYASKNGELQQIEGVSFTTDSNLVEIKDGNLHFVGGGDALIKATFEYEGKSYEKELTVHIYGKNNCSFTFLDGTVDHSLQATCGDVVPLEIVNELGNPEYNKAVKAFYVNGELVTGDAFIMPDEDVEVSIRFLNDTIEDFTENFTAGHLLNNVPATVLYETKELTDAEGNTPDNGGYVRFTTTSWGSLNYNFDESVVVNEKAVVRLKVYMPTDTVLLYFGIATEESFDKANPTKRYEAANNDVHPSRDVPWSRIQPDMWQILEFPLSAFVNVGEKLKGISISCSPSDLYIDYISVYQGLEMTDVGYMDNVLYKAISSAETGSQAQMLAIGDYYKWAKGLTAEEKTSQTHQANVAKIRTLINETYDGKASVVYNQSPTATNTSWKEFDRKDDTHGGKFKSDVYSYMDFFQYSKKAGAKQITFEKMAFNAYGEVSFGLYAACTVTAINLTVNGVTAELPTAGIGADACCRVVVKDGTLQVFDDRKNQESTLLLTVELPEAVVNGSESLVFSLGMMQTLVDGGSNYAVAEMSEFKAQISADDIV